jgi:hypothetical protein
MLMTDGNKALDATVCVCIYTASDALALIKRGRRRHGINPLHEQKSHGVKLKGTISLKTPFYR